MVLYSASSLIWCHAHTPTHIHTILFLSPLFFFFSFFLFSLFPDFAKFFPNININITKKKRKKEKEKRKLVVRERVEREGKTYNKSVDPILSHITTWHGV
jgi:hypothetical protein